jgi:hypothetical protein
MRKNKSTMPAMKISISTTSEAVLRRKILGYFLDSGRARNYLLSVCLFILYILIFV